MSNLVVVGAQWGDEGKGKLVDLLSRDADAVVRFGGGNNAGHTLQVAGRQVILHLIPSGVLHPGKHAVLGDAMVIDPGALLEEMDALAALGVELAPGRCLVSSRAHLILPYHRIIDGLREGGAAALGTTRRGIGPAYEDKAARRGVRAGDLLRPHRLDSRLPPAVAEANARIAQLGGEPVDPQAVRRELDGHARRLAPFVTDTHGWLQDAMAAGQRLLFEGAQGVLLDIDHGTYPYVTSSVTLPAGAAFGAGVSPALLGRIVGVAKAYTTRVGAGPFPTELDGAEGERLRGAGHEYGATTGRPRRCGWLDLVALRYAIQVAGIQELALTKLDVLAGIEPVKICVGYELDGRRLARPPDDAEELDRVVPVLEELEGFESLPGSARTRGALPRAAIHYVERVAHESGVPVRWVSVGPERDETIAWD